MAKKKTTKVTCSNCDEGSEVLSSSVSKEKDTIWQCPHCGEQNIIELDK